MAKDRKGKKAQPSERLRSKPKAIAKPNLVPGQFDSGQQTIGRSKPKVIQQSPNSNATALIDGRFRELGDWRGETLQQMRDLILQVDRSIMEEWKWNNPVWSCQGIVCTGEAYANVVKLTFARGAALPDPNALFNSSLEGKTRRAIDIRKGEKLNARAFKALIKAAIAQNRGTAPQSAKTRKAQPVKLLSGGNPQIAKAHGNAPVKVYIEAMPGWKREVGRWLDRVIEETVPTVTKAVKWNTPFYGLEGQGWFTAFHCMTKYVKVAFFRGSMLCPMPPGKSKQKDVRYFDIYENDPLDEAQFAEWIKQASRLPGEKM